MLVALGVLLAVSVLYNVRLHKRLRAYEHVWEQIEKVADHNQDGTFTINIQHLEDVHGHASTEAHLNVDESGVHLLDIDELENETNDGPPRAA